MATCSIRSCNETAIAGFAEQIEVSSINFPRRRVPCGTRYWCRRHEVLSLEVRGKLGEPIDLSEAMASGISASADADLAGVPANQLGTASQPAPGEQRSRERFRVDGLAEVAVGNTGVLFRGTTHDLSQNGCYIDSKAYLSASVGEEVEVRFSVGDVHLRAVAKVRVVKRGKGAGFEFLHVKEDAQNCLDSLLDRLGQPPLAAQAAPTGFAIDGSQ